MASAGIRVVNIPLPGQLDPGRLPADRPPEAPDLRTSYEQPLCASGVKLAAMLRAIAEGAPPVLLH